LKNFQLLKNSKFYNEIIVMIPFNFDFVAESYDEYYQSNFGKKIDFVEKRLVKTYLDKIPNKKALEIGCGTGHWTQFFSENNFEMIGIDISEKMIEQAKRKNIPNANFFVQNCENLNFPTENLENVFAITSLEFLENKEKAIEEIYRVLKPEGYFLIGCLNIHSYLGKIRNENEIFKNADFFDAKSLDLILKKFGNPTIEGSALIDENLNVLDFESKIEADKLINEGAFLVGFVQKKIRNN